MMNVEKSFLEWANCYSFAIGWDRYDCFNNNWSFVALAASNNETFTVYRISNEQLDIRELADCFDGGDNEALSSCAVAKESVDHIGVDKNPAKAMEKCVESLRKYFINEIYGGATNE